MILRSRSFTSSSDQEYAWMSCTHSKYETVTPPALARMSGTTAMPRWAKISSASGSVGPFAASTMIEAFTRSALSRVSWPSIAAGMRRSQSNSKSSSLVTSCAPSRPWRPPVSAWCCRSASGVSPSGS